MKNAEKIFMAINNVDERLIDEAKGKDEKPVLIRVEKHLPIKEIIAFAACFVILVSGILALFKFRIGAVGSVDSGTNPNITVSNPEEPDTPENMELQAILKDLTANAIEIDGIFTRLAEQGEGYYSTSQIRRYYPAGDNRKTEPLGLFTVPQTCSEIEQLLHTCFTERSVEHYMNDVAAGHLTTGDDGETVIAVDSSSAYRLKLIETDGKLYHTLVSYYDVKLDIDHTTAMVTSKTDKTIKFTYWDTNGVLSETEGVIVLEDGVWKFDYFYDTGFAPVIPTEFTEEDKELQDILNELSAGNDLYAWFNRGVGFSEEYMFRNSLFPNDRYMYTLLPKGEKHPYSGFEYPQSCEQLEELLLKYFTQENVDKLMKNAAKGTMSENSDGTYTITADTKGKYLPIFLEIDGNTYIWRRDGGGTAPIWNTAKVTEKTDDSIKFTVIYNSYDQYYSEDGLIKYERGGWKLNYDWDMLTGEGPELSDEAIEDAKLRGILKDLIANAVELDKLFTGGIGENGEEYVFVYDDGYKSTSSYYRITGDIKTKPDGKFTVPQSRQGFEELLSGYFSKRAVKSYLKRISSGVMTENSDGTYWVTTDQGYLTTFIEINGELYGESEYDSDRLTFDPNTASVISKTNNTIKFSYTRGESSDSREGVLVYEDGGWKLNHFYWGGFIAEYPTEFTAEDEELQDILNELSPGEIIQDWFSSAGERYYAQYCFVFDELENAENLLAYYNKLPTGKFDGGKESYPRSYSELQTLLLKYFTQKNADYFMRKADKGTVTSVSDNKYHVKTERSLTAIEKIPHVLEIDGEMYYMISEKSGNQSTLWDSAKVVSKTDDTINYSYILGYMDGIFTAMIKYERGGWRLSNDMIDHLEE